MIRILIVCPVVQWLDGLLLSGLVPVASHLAAAFVVSEPRIGKIIFPQDVSEIHLV